MFSNTVFQKIYHYSEVSKNSASAKVVSWS